MSTRDHVILYVNGQRHEIRGERAFRSLSDFLRYDLGLIGNCSFLALVKKDTNISWMCWPRFDSSFVFGSLLDEEKGGEYTIKPAEGEFEADQRYVENTNILSTEITTAEGSYRGRRWR